MKVFGYPNIHDEAFTCGHCGQFSKQIYYEIGIHNEHSDEFIGTANKCGACEGLHIWLHDEWKENYTYIYPLQLPIPSVNEDFPGEVRKYYIEAAAIVNQSPRGAAALLRLAIQVLIRDILNNPNEKINDGISKLVQKGLPPTVQKALDIVRVTGNDAVHPGMIDTDDIEVVGKLFNLINIIVERMITDEKQVNELYKALPKDKLKGIDDRDQMANKKTDQEETNA